MGIIGGVAKVRVIKTSQVEYILPLDGGKCEIKLADGAELTPWPYVYFTPSYGYSKEKTSGGYLWTHRVTGQISPVSAEKEAFIDSWAGQDFIALVDLKTGGTKVMGSLAISCTVEEGAEVSAGIETNALTIDLVWLSPQRARSLKTVL